MPLSFLQVCVTDNNRPESKCPHLQRLDTEYAGKEANEAAAMRRGQPAGASPSSAVGRQQSRVVASPGADAAPDDHDEDYVDDEEVRSEESSEASDEDTFDGEGGGGAREGRAGERGVVGGRPASQEGMRQEALKTLIEVSSTPAQGGPCHIWDTLGRLPLIRGPC
ncbi:unnamed protein product [Vitrella brassicaformis CCMP3155]|uniref:Uncharacterized protein n=1 Tax=Vitrella brassicaformis (strain CCMP3155) TaxID=1169540 RepID=A0A0G4EFQ8_VITBC|nr:unnamed protein product [Vitrella brassicaformis CCMP3155]|eukprot:CEL94215.1 unnamed protein product [Vitrella brassicaformis CCMP3155]